MSRRVERALWVGNVRITHPVGEGKRLAASLPVAGAAMGMGHGENLDDGCHFAVNRQKGEAAKHELARVMRVARPRMRGLSDHLDCVGDLLGETGGD